MSTVDHRTGRPYRSFFIRYTLLFLGISVLVFLPFLYTGRSFVNKVDGMPQYVVYLRYMGQYLRLCAEHILHGNLSFPLYDFSIGMGDDIGQIVRFHPLDFLSVFVPSSCTEVLYGVILLLRFYLAGVTFSLFAFYWNTVPVSGEKQGLAVSETNVLSGSLVYVFCGFMMIRVMNHPIYAAPFIVLPLLLTGAEKVLRGQGVSLFVFSVFLGFWSNYYFMYIMSAALFVYMLVRFFEEVSPAGVKSFFSLFLKMIFLYALGLAMSMMTLLPTMYRYFSSARQVQTSDTHSMLFYEDKRRYIAWFLNLISPYQSSGNGTDLNYAVIVLPCLAVLFALGRRRYRSLKKFLILDLIMLLVPFFGYVLAVFNNENNRWMFLISLCLGMTVVFTADQFAVLTKKQTAAILLASGMFLAAVALQTVTRGFNIYNMAAAVELILAVGALLICARRKVSVEAVRRVVLGITCLSVVCSGFLTYEPRFGAVAEDYVESGKTMSAYEQFWRSRGAALIKEDSFFRVDGFGVKHGRENSAQFSDYNSTSEYNSILNAGLLDAMLQINNIGQDAVTILKGLDARPVSMNLAHVRYFITRQKNSGIIPYGYSKAPSAQIGKVQVYENEQPLSFGYSYDTFITRENYDRLDPLQKEMVQLEAVVLPEPDGGQEDLEDTLRSAGLQEIREPSCAILEDTSSLSSEGEGFTYKDSVLSVGKGAVIPIEYQKKQGYDTYLQLTGLKINGQMATLRVKGDGFSTKTLIRGSSQVYTIGRENYLFHMGYAEEDSHTQAYLRFTAGTYELSSVKVFYVPMEDYGDKIAALNEDSLLEEQTEDGMIRGNISLRTPKMLVLSVPAADGWTLRTDGVKTDIATVNLMYQGMILPEGKHEIELTYRTPGLTTGRCIAIPAILVWILLAGIERKKKKRTTADAGE